MEPEDVCKASVLATLLISFLLLLSWTFFLDVPRSEGVSILLAETSRCSEGERDVTICSFSEDGEILSLANKTIEIKGKVCFSLPVSCNTTTIRIRLEKSNRTVYLEIPRRVLG